MVVRIDTIRPMNDFAERRVPDLRNHAARFGKRLKAVDSCDDSLSEEGCVTNRVASHIGIDCLDVFDCPTGPNDPRHLRSRSFAS